MHKNGRGPFRTPASKDCNAFAINSKSPSLPASPWNQLASPRLHPWSCGLKPNPCSTQKSTCIPTKYLTSRPDLMRPASFTNPPRSPWPFALNSRYRSTLNEPLNPEPPPISRASPRRLQALPSPVCVCRRLRERTRYQSRWPIALAYMMGKSAQVTPRLGIAMAI